ncbi:MAG TPA: 4Fe-4S ferredoxin [Planctomycetes bacterium]|nr:4Fe-4S ferredoxin [Planctomycetota bacterium]
MPLGEFRTWVKYVEKGAFPEVRRHFTVLRCNHCDAAPCVEICPVNALHKRPDAIVDLDRDVCIGCQACMQACPYDALYLNPDTGTAEKCHYCAHRTEQGLEPACVVVCPEEAIIAGDMDDKDSRIATLVRNEKTSRRKVEKGTKPRVWYVDALDEALEPGRAEEPDTWLWSDRKSPPPKVPDFSPEPDVITTLNTDHPPAWGWHVWSYLLTKNLAAGAMLVAPFLAWLGAPDGIWPEVFSLIFQAITLFLLIADLGKPERFWRLLLTPNSKSWLVKGAWVLGAFGVLTSAALGARWLEMDTLASYLRWATIPAALLASGYSAFLFAQCKGRDLWTHSGLFLTLTSRAALLGIVTTAAVMGGASTFLAGALLITLLLNIGLLLHERQASLPTDEGRRAHALLMAKPGPTFLLTALIAALWIPAAFFIIPNGNLPTQAVLISCLLITVAMLAMERDWIRAGQEVPIS